METATYKLNGLSLKLVHRSFSPDTGVTGLEAAIILIAFIVVAAVFGYSIIGTGFLTTQKSGEMIHTGVRQAESSLVPGGTVVAQADALGTNLGTIDIYLENPFGETGTNVDHITYVISTLDVQVMLPPGDTRVNTTFLVSVNANRLLEKRELIKVTLTVPGLLLTSGKKFGIEIQPSAGNTLYLQRTVPASLSANTHYELLT
jgi:flagellin FlaB